MLILYICRNICLYLCKHCEHGLGTRPDMSKHGGNLFSPAMLNNWHLDNAPYSAMMGILVGNLVRIYRLSTDPYPLLKAVQELVVQAQQNGLGMSRVKNAITTKVFSLVHAEPRPEGRGTSREQEEFRTFLLQGVRAILCSSGRGGRRQLQGTIQRVMAQLQKEKRCSK